MATAAELKARLLKYAKPTTAPLPSEPVVPASENEVETSSPSVVVSGADLQPTTLVVVERPDETGDGVSTVQETNLDVTNPVHSNFLQLLNDVEAALLARDPLMKTHLGAIHKNMLQHEEIANLLRPEEIAKIMAAQQAHTGIVLRAETVGKSKAAASKKAAQLGLNDV